MTNYILRWTYIIKIRVFKGPVIVLEIYFKEKNAHVPPPKKGIIRIFTTDFVLVKKMDTT